MLPEYARLENAQNMTTPPIGFLQLTDGDRHLVTRYTQPVFYAFA